MMDTYSSSVEQIIKTKAPKMSGMYKVLPILAAILSLTTIPAVGVYGILLCAFFIAVTVVLFKYYDAEYEYSLTDGELTVDKIMSQSWRKRCGVYNIARAELIADIGSQEALRLERRQVRTSDYSAGDNSDGVIVIYAFNSDNETERIFIQPDERMLEALSKVAPRGAYKVETVISKEADE